MYDLISRSKTLDAIKNHLNTVSTGYGSSDHLLEAYNMACNHIYTLIENLDSITISEDSPQLYIECRNNTPHRYIFGNEVDAYKLFIDGGYSTPEEAIQAWKEQKQ